MNSRTALKSLSYIKNYLLWPLVALSSTMAIYLTFVFTIHKALLSSPYGEELLWRFAVGKDFLGIYGDARGQNLQKIIDELPTYLLPEKYTKLKIIIAQDEDLNAFAAPGGRIILTTGLLSAVKSENALLFVIGHEIGHLSRKDHLHEFSRKIIANLYGIITWSNLVPELLMLIDNNKAKEIEFLADQWALKIILEHYGHVGGAEEFFQILLRHGDQENMLSSHPLTSKRLEKIQNIITSKNLEVKKTIAF
jgi:Zn-dependent protease with chaperone function